MTGNDEKSEPADEQAELCEKTGSTRLEITDTNYVKCPNVDGHVMPYICKDLCKHHDKKEQVKIDKEGVQAIACGFNPCKTCPWRGLKC